MKPGTTQIIDNRIIALFLEKSGPDAYGRYLQDILKFTDEELEQCHDQIQWSFPLHEESNFAVIYPIITEEFIEKYNNKIIQKNMLESLARFKDFLGIAPKSREKHYLWCNNHNHNLLRITRIIRSLRMFGLEKEAEKFYSEVLKIGYGMMISKETLGYWSKAMTDPIWKTLR